MSEHHRDVGLPLERRTARKQLEEDAGERVNVRSSVHGGALDLLRGGVVDRAREDSFPAQAVDGCRVLRKAEVGEKSAVAVLDQDISGLDVAVDEASLVGGVQGLGDAGQDLESSFRLEPSFELEQLSEIAAPHVSHGDKEVTV